MRLQDLIARSLSWPRRRDRHFLAVPSLRLAYGRIPKVANSAIRTTLARHVERIPGCDLPPNTDRFWTGAGAVGTAMLTARELERDHPDLFVFSFVRNPFDRLVSCWSDMIRDPQELLPALAALGFTPRMTFPDFVERAARISDEQADLHFRSQASMLSLDGVPVPDFVGCYESLDRDWETVRIRVEERCGTDLGPLPQINVRRRDRSDVPSRFADPGLADLVRERYADDFRLFYPDEMTPAAGPAMSPRPQDGSQPAK